MVICQNIFFQMRTDTFLKVILIDFYSENINVSRVSIYFHNKNKTILKK
jgi:hypothetical protein